MRIKDKPAKLIDFIGNHKFTIPLYQREYSWEVDQVSDLYYDIENSTDDTGHFLGSLLLYEKNGESKELEVIDGQQRLTTLFLLLYSIKKILKDSNEHEAISDVNKLLYIKNYDYNSNDKSIDQRLVTGKRDGQLFKTILAGEDYKSFVDKRLKSHKLLLGALHDFFDFKTKEIFEKRGLPGINTLLQKLVNSQFIVMTAEQSDERILLFKTLNARGLELSIADLIKNELCNKLRKINEKDAVDLWDQIREVLEESKANIDFFVFHYINSREDAAALRKSVDQSRNKDTGAENFPPVPEKYIFDVYAKLLENQKNTKYFLTEFKNAAIIYSAFVAPQSNSVSLENLKSMGINKCFPLLLKAKKILTDKNFIKIAHAVDVISFRHSILKKDPKELEKFYYQLMNKLVSNEDAQAVVEDIGGHPTVKDEVQFKANFIVASLKPSVSKMILDRIIKKHSESIDWTQKGVHIEHIMPQKPAGVWQTLFMKNETDYKDYLNRLGNLTVLQDKLNIRASNLSFDEKRKFYRKSRLKITKDLDSLVVWDYQAITKRQEDLYNEATKIWSLKQVTKKSNAKKNKIAE